MCGRYRTKDTDPEEFSDRFAPYGPALADALGQIEVRPTDTIAIVGDGEEGGRLAGAVRWGIQPDGARRPLINARADKLLQSGLWSRSMRTPGRRVLIPADGWYEWLAAEDPKVRKQPFLHRVDGGGPFAFAGLLGSAVVKGERMRAATIVTTDAAGPPARIHDRMPVVLADRDAEDAWLRGDADDDLVRALCVPIDGTRVSVEPVTL